MIRLRLPLFALIILIFTGCATYPKPRFEKDMYINPEFEFSITIPEGWEKVEKPPSWLAKDLPFGVTHKIRLLLFNKETNSMIGLMSDSSIIDARMLSSYTLEKIYKDRYEDQKKANDQNPYISNYRYFVRSNAFDCLDMPIVEQTLTYETDFQTLRGDAKTFFYNCHKDDSCELTVFYFSDVKTFDLNYRYYSGIIDSLKRWTNGIH